MLFFGICADIFVFRYLNTQKSDNFLSFVLPGKKKGGRVRELKSYAKVNRMI